MFCMDSTDYRILSCLATNSREKISDISKTVNLSVSAVIERIKKMEANGIIEKYSLILNQERLGNSILAIVKVKLLDVSNCQLFIDNIMDNYNITTCYSITGDFDYMLKIVCKSNAQLQSICHNIRLISGVSNTKTELVLSTIKDEHCTIPKDLK